MAYLSVHYDYMESGDKEVIITKVREFIQEEIGRSFFAVLAQKDGKVVSCAYLVLSRRLANLSFMTGYTGCVLNVFTYPEHRRNGYAESVMREIIRMAEVKNLSYLELSATASGKRLYDKLGFVEKEHEFAEMKLILNQEV